MRRSTRRKSNKNTGERPNTTVVCMRNESTTKNANMTHPNNRKTETNQTQQLATTCDTPKMPIVCKLARFTTKLELFYVVPVLWGTGTVCTVPLKLESIFWDAVSLSVFHPGGCWPRGLLRPWTTFFVGNRFFAPRGRNLRVGLPQCGSRVRGFW